MSTLSQTDFFTYFLCSLPNTMSLLKQLMIAKYHPTSEYLYTEAKKQFFLLKKYYYAVDLQSNKFSAKWM